MKIYKKWLKTTFVLVILFSICFEINYRLNSYYRHEVDEKVAILDKTRDNDFNIIILSDSVTLNALKDIRIKNEIYNLSTNEAISFAGNYFLLKRYLSNNIAPKKVFIFIVPHLLINNLKSQTATTYFESVFYRKDEISKIKELGRNDLYKNIYFKLFQIQMQLRYRAFKSQLFKFVKSQNATISLLDVRNNLDLEKNDIYKQEVLDETDFKTLLDTNKSSMSEIAKIFLKEIYNLCKANNTELMIILEPINPDVYPMWSNSALKKDFYKFLSENNIKFEDVNTLYSFPQAAFLYDAIHLRPNWNYKYALLIDEHILDLDNN
ncbi:MAG: hypothetical protein ACD_20C00413G0001 [uncultured bacterium]|nr:MAG: hypothetical protein ACD_20C00413G0001 [uncultured bacterium]